MTNIWSCQYLITKNCSQQNRSIFFYIFCFLKRGFGIYFGEWNILGKCVWWKFRDTKNLICSKKSCIKSIKKFFIEIWKFCRNRLAFSWDIANLWIRYSNKNLKTRLVFEKYAPNIKNDPTKSFCFLILLNYRKIWSKLAY